MPHRLHPNDPRPNSIGGFELPRFNSGLGRELITGRGVSVYFDQQPPNAWTEHFHGVVQILVALDSVDAVASWNLNGEQRRHGVTGQFVWLLPAGTPHALEWLGHAGMVALYVETSFVREVCGTDLTKAVIDDFSALARSDILACRLTGEFRELCRRSKTAAPAIVESAGTLLVTLILRHFVLRKTNLRLPSDCLRKVLDNIDAHIGEKIFRESLARVAGISVRTLSDGFKDQTGLTLVAYIMQRRTILAMAQVDAGIFTKTAIAADFGFSDQSHMMRRIRKLRKAEEIAAAKAAQASTERPKEGSAG